MKTIRNTKTTKKTKKIIGAVTTYHGDEHRYLRGYKVRIVAVLKNAAKPDIDVDGPEYANINDEEELRCVGGVTANDRIEVQPWLKEEGRFSFVTSDPKATDLALFKNIAEASKVNKHKKHCDRMTHDDLSSKKSDVKKRNSDTKNKKPRTYPVQFKDETRYVTVPGSDDPQPGPDSEASLETFLAEAIEAYSEMSGIVQPRVATFEKAGYSNTKNGLIVRVGQIEYRLTITRSR